MLVAEMKIERTTLFSNCLFSHILHELLILEQWLSNAESMWNKKIQKFSIHVYSTQRVRLYTFHCKIYIKPGFKKYIILPHLGD